MRPPAPDVLTGSDADFAIAVYELRKVTEELRQWSNASDAEDPDRLTGLQNCLDRILDVDLRITQVRQERTDVGSDWKAVDDTYADGLRDAIETVQSLARLLETEKENVLPQLDAGVRQREVHSAYLRNQSR